MEKEKFECFVIVAHTAKAISLIFGRSFEVNIREAERVYCKI